MKKRSWGFCFWFTARYPLLRLALEFGDDGHDEERREAYLLEVGVSNRALSGHPPRSMNKPCDPPMTEIHAV
jgi:hypothetical protein